MRLSARKTLSAAISIAIVIYIAMRMDPDQLGEELTSVSWGWLGGIMLLLAANLLCVSWRLDSLLRHFGARQGFRTAFRANISGLASSLFLISIIGAVLGRQIVLQRQGVSPALVTILTGYERVILLLVGCALAILGGLVLFGPHFWQDLNKTMPLWQVGLALSLAAALCLYWGRKGAEVRLLAQTASWQNIARLAGISGITLCAQAFAISTYVLAFLALGTEASPLQLLAGAAVVSFAASLPISVNGWGVRELAAIAVFGQLGASPHEAVAASVLVGLCSTVAVLAATPYALIDHFRSKTETAPALPVPAAGVAITQRMGDRDMERLLAILCGIGAAILLFFQVRLEVSGNAVTANLADPIALSALAAMAAYFLFQHKLPVALPKWVWLWLGGITLVLIVGFLNGVMQFGVTPWALSNRLFGWLVILGYITCGALIASQFGAHGRRTLIHALTASATIVIGISFLSDIAASAGFGRRVYLDGLAGFSGNRNTFALQLMLVLAVFLACVPTRKNFSSLVAPIVMCAIIIIGIWQSGSKLGLGVTLTLLLCVTLAQRQTLSVIGTSVLLAVFGYALLGFAPEIVRELGLWLDMGAQLNLTGSANPVVRFVEPLHAGAFDERLVSIAMGIDLWLSNPILGAGLGSAIRQNLGFAGSPLVIHSTPIWILAEFGLIGLTFILSLPCWLLWQHRQTLWQQISRRRITPFTTGILGICLSFGLFGLAHEIAYQRLFWLLIGAYAAQTIVSRPTDASTPR